MEKKLIYFVLLSSLIFSIIFIPNADCKKHSETGTGKLDGKGNNGPHISFCPIDMNFSVSNTSIGRTDLIVLSVEYQIDPTYNKNITNFSYIDYLNKTFKIIKVDGQDVKPSTGKIEINGNLNRSKSKSKNWTLCTDNETAAKPIYLFDSKMRKLGPIEREGESNKEHIKIIPNIYYSGSDTTNIKIFIKNKPPEINESETRVEVFSPQIGDDQKLIYWDFNNPLEVNHIVSAKDIEDYDQLQYIWTLQNKNNSSIEFITNSSKSIYHWKLKPGDTILFNVKARDLDGDYSETIVAGIIGKDNKTIYKNIYVPPWAFYSTNLIIIIIIAIIIYFLKFKSYFCFPLNIFLYNIRNHFKDLAKNPLTRALILTLLITTIFIFLYIFNINIWHIYSISLAFYELYPFIIIYILFGYLAEKIYFEKDTMPSKYIVLLVNDLLMIIILVSFYGISSGITHDIYEHLSKYYSTIAQVSGTLLGLILGFYIAKFDNKEIERPDLYLKALEYLVLLYGTLIFLSLWGLSLTETIFFTPLIEFIPENLTNIVSIWVFESTLLLVPLAITSLYRLIKLAK